MPLDFTTTDFTLTGLRPFPSAITSVGTGPDGTRVNNGCIVLSAGNASVLHEAPRLTIGLTKANLTHDMVVESGVFVMHLLSGDADHLGASLTILMALGGSSGHDGDKMSGLAVKEGETGAPILLDALTYLECKVLRSMDADENTIFLADVVAAERLRKGPKLDVGKAWGNLPAEWLEAYDKNHHLQIEDARARRNLN